MPVKANLASDPARVARLREALQNDLDRMLQWRGPVAEVRRLVAELDSLPDTTIKSPQPVADSGQRQAQDQMAHSP